MKQMKAYADAHFNTIQLSTRNIPNKTFAPVWKAFLHALNVSEQLQLKVCVCVWLYCSVIYLDLLTHIHTYIHTHIHTDTNAHISYTPHTHTRHTHIHITHHTRILSECACCPSKLVVFICSDIRYW